MLEQVDIHRWQVEQFVQQFVSLHHQVVFRFTRYFDAGLVQAILSTAFMQQIYFQRIFNGNGVEYGFKVMVSVRTFLRNIQSQVYFAIRKGQHCSIEN